ncbi:MAG: histone deacetylase family protein, partial [Oxalobacter sp.]|nr:histone deacetylase family protein [Oxalobacter sp.]
MTTAVYFHPYNELHEMGARHPESPARMRTMFRAFKESGLDDVLQYRISPEAMEKDIRRVHIQDMINVVKDVPDPGFYNYVDETPLNHYSW